MCSKSLTGGVAFCASGVYAEITFQLIEDIILFLKLFGNGRDSSSIGLLCYFEPFLLFIFPPRGLFI
jgi:hypothetical protein